MRDFTYLATSYYYRESYDNQLRIHMSTFNSKGKYQLKDYDVKRHAENGPPGTHSYFCLLVFVLLDNPDMHKYKPQLTSE